MKPGKSVKTKSLCFQCRDWNNTTSCKLLKYAVHVGGGGSCRKDQFVVRVKPLRLHLNNDLRNTWNFVSPEKW